LSWWWGLRSETHSDGDLAYYEGLVFKTAQLVVRAGVEIEVEDAQQRLRIKVWRALKAFDPAKCRTSTSTRRSRTTTC
jgi:hypothetical protein